LNWGSRMTKSILVAVMGLTLLSVNAASAQSEGQCDQVRAAVSQYGYKAAKAHAEATMSPEAVRAASNCLTHKHAATARPVVMRKRHRARHTVR
jgi:hypothetical protein